MAAQSVETTDVAIELSAEAGDAVVEQGGARGITVEQLNRALASQGWEAVDHPAMGALAHEESEGRVALLCRKLDNPKLSYNCMLLTPDGHGGMLSGVFGVALPSDWQLSPEQMNKFNALVQSIRFAKLHREPQDRVVIDWDFVCANLSDAALSEIFEIWNAWATHIVRGLHEAIKGNER